MNAEERLTDFIYNLSKRCSARGFSAKEFRLTITRGDISNYLVSQLKLSVDYGDAFKTGYSYSKSKKCGGISPHFLLFYL